MVLLHEGSLTSDGSPGTRGRAELSFWLSCVDALNVCKACCGGLHSGTQLLFCYAALEWFVLFEERYHCNLISKRLRPG